MPASDRPALPGWLAVVLRTPNLLYANGLGWVFGHRFVQIVHVGRRSGRTRHTVVEVLGYDPASGETVVVSGLGRSADWLRNLCAAGSGALDFGHGPRPATVRLLGEDEAVAVLTAYERRNRLVRPVVHRVLTVLAGWPYDGSPEATRRLVRQLPLVAFRPAGTRA